jgi:DNA replication protein DnaC
MLLDTKTEWKSYPQTQPQNGNQGQDFAKAQHRPRLEAELSDRGERRLKRNLTAAHLPVEKRIEDFDFERVTGIAKSGVTNLLDFRWIDLHENLVFLGPPGIGKTLLSIGVSLAALYAGYTVVFERMSNLVQLLKTGEIKRASAFRINRIVKSHVLVIDEIGYTPIDRREANLFFNLVSELYERTSMIITSNKGFDEWAEMMGDEIGHSKLPQGGQKGLPFPPA